MGAGFCSLYREIHYIQVRYIEVSVYKHLNECIIFSYINEYGDSNTMYI